MTGEPSSPSPPGFDGGMPESHSPDEEGMVPGSRAAQEAIARGAVRRKLRIGLLISIFTLASLTLVLEVGLRLVGDRQAALEAGVNRTNRRWVALLQAGIFEEVEDNVRRYAMRPGASCEVDGWTFRVTSHRSRGADFPKEKPADEKRIVVLGDSFCFGMWSDEDKTLAGHLGRLANEHERANGGTATWRAVNLGVPGYHSGQQLAALEDDGLGLDPDVVVIYYNTNDIDREGFFFDADLGALRNDHLPLPTSLRRVLWNSHLYGFIVRKHDQALRSIPMAHLDPSVPWANVREDNQTATARSLERIQELCRERDIPLFMIGQPLWTWSGDTRSKDWEVLPLVQWQRDLRERLDIPGIDLLGLLRGYQDGVDRFGTPEENENLFAVDAYVADEAVVEAFDQARALAAKDGLNWDELSLGAQLPYFSQVAAEVPAEPDFHLTGEGYEHIARLAYPAMQAAGMVP